MPRFWLGAVPGRWTICLALAAMATTHVAQAGTVAAGASHTLVVKTTDSTVWAWGLNSDGQLGDNTVTQRKTPIQVTSLSGIVAVAAGAKHSLALKSDGSLWAWGDNANGQIGNGTTTDQRLPVQVLTGVSAVAAGDYHTIALKLDGTVWTWGLNGDGQLGDGGTTSRSSPGQVTGLGLVGAIAGGGNHTVVVLQAGGAMKAWGKNANGQLGDGTTTRALNPVSVSGVSNAVVAVGGGAFTLARKNDATLLAWGLNSSGQLGLGDTTRRKTATAVTALTNVATMVAGVAHGVALLGDASVRAWGRNTYGNLGDGSTTQRNSPVTVASLAGIVAVGVGQNHNIAVTSTGEVWAWGYNNQYQIGDGRNVNRLVPVKVAEAGFQWKAGTPTISPASGTFNTNQTVTMTTATSGGTIRYTTDGTDPTDSSTAYSAALSVTVGTAFITRTFKAGLAPSNPTAATYTLKALPPSFTPPGGSYTSAQTVTLATTTTGATIRYTTDGSDPTPSSAVYTGPLAVGSSATIRAAAFKTGWTTSDISSATYSYSFGTLPAPVLTPASGTYVDSVTVDITATSGATIRHTTDGSDPTASSPLYTLPVSLTLSTTLKAGAWKTDYDPSPISSGTYTLKVAAPILNPTPGSYPIGTAIAFTAVTAESTLHYTTNGVDPTEADPAIASGATIAVGNFTLKVRAFKDGCVASDVTGGAYTAAPRGMVAAGEGFSLAVLEDGTVWSWGRNYNGRLGLGDQYDRPTPNQITTLTGIRAVATGAAHALALTNDGHVWAWGLNNAGQLGVTGAGYSSLTPVQTSLTSVVAIAAGGESSAALKADGTLLTWGRNDYGQLGLGNTQNQPTPTQVLTGVAKIAAGWSFAVALMNDGSLKAWGANSAGQVGDGTSYTRTSPVTVALTSVVDIACGDGHTLAQRADGSLWAWGYNANGQLANGNNANQLSPIQVAGVTIATADGGMGHSIVALTDGTVRTWGRNYYGQLGNNSKTEAWGPVAPAGPTAVVSVAGGDSHTLAMTMDGSIWAWGWDWWGQVGEGGAQADRLVPVKIRDGSLWIVDAPTLGPAGATYYYDVSPTVNVATWGATIHYTTNSADPTLSDPVIANGTPLPLGQSRTVKLRAWKDGMAPSPVRTEVYQLNVPAPSVSPYGTTYSTPQTVTISCSVSGVEIHYTTNGADPTMADPLIASGGTLTTSVSQTVKAKAWRSGWGDSTVGAQTYTLVVGTPTLTPSGGSLALGQPILPASVTPAAEFHYTVNGLDPTLADPVVPPAGITLSASGTVRVKGWRPGWTPSNSVVGSYYVIEGTVAPPVLTPAAGTFAMPQTVTIATSTPGAVVRCAFDGTAANSLSAVCPASVNVASTTSISAVAFLAGWAPSISAGGTYVIQGSTAALPTIAPPGGRLASGRAVRVYTAEPGVVLRYTTNGIDPTDSDSTVASGGTVLVGRSMRLKVRAWKAGLEPSPVASADFEVVGAVAAGAYHSIALRSDGTVAAWGSNDRGQLGDGTNTPRSAPVNVVGLSDVVAISAGAFHNLALKSDGTVWSWGESSDGQLGIGTSGSWTARNTPAQVATSSGPLTDVVAIAAGGYHSVALKADGSVWIWGSDFHGQLGLGDGTWPYLRSRPVQVPGLSGVTAISAGAIHTLALQTNGAVSGRVWGWGYNAFGTLADGTPTDRLSPVLVAADALQAFAGSVETFVVKPDGSILGAGRNNHGQLGNGSTADQQLSLTPALLGVTAPAKVAASGVHALALAQDGEVRGTGFNHRGQVGDGSKLDKLSLVPVALLANVVDVSASVFVEDVYVSTEVHSIALTVDGRVWTWGSNAGLALGNGGGGYDHSYRPQPLSGFSTSDRTWPDGDPDGDGLTSEEELQVGTDPFNADTNGDGVSDRVAIRSGVSATSLDVDADGVSNAAELQNGTDPLTADTDGDGASDATDCFPRDPTRSTCPLPVPGDVTPPVITLTEPASAVLLTSVP